MSSIKSTTLHRSAGGAVLCKKNQTFRIALIKLADNTWVLPKGHIEQGETLKKAAEREIREELGIQEKLRYIGKIGTEHYYFSLPQDEKVQRKQVFLYAFALDSLTTLKAQTEERFIEAKWFQIDRAKNIIQQNPFITRRFFLIGKKKVKKQIDSFIISEAKKIAEKSWGKIVRAI